MFNVEKHQEQNLRDAIGKDAFAVLEGMEEPMDEGDRVTWTHSYRRGRTVNFTTREGKIVRLIGSKADVKYRGELFRLKLDRLRKVGVRSELTDMVMGTGDHS
jgi:hypothetical protein